MQQAARSRSVSAKSSSSKAPAVIASAALMAQITSLSQISKAGSLMAFPLPAVTGQDIRTG